ncbi:indolepyruvate ferredoxin oxidoreductase subunit alpha [Polycyclovorans algicola]|uniref:indolepyruvate ferredoxin oxidoreductase subunit alpha n=1 Tax=Polycyclovorans algicola TaxID=616992 RepID=UPI0004A6E950|nr:ferredoxin family protein [Polycyclovorans algicola]
MTHVVTDNCQRCRFTECVATCPVACFRGDDEMLYIDPDTCIDCGACVPACPVQAIQEAFDLPPDQEHWIARNAQQAGRLPVVRQTGTPLPTAEARRAELGF